MRTCWYSGSIATARSDCLPFTLVHHPLAVTLALTQTLQGENICFEVITTVHPYMRCAAGNLPGAYPDAAGRACIYRAPFSSLAPVDLITAVSSLVHPNLNERCVDEIGVG